MFRAASQALVKGAACPAMALRELKVCLLGVSAPRPALCGALVRAGVGGTEGAWLERLCLGVERLCVRPGRLWVGGSLPGRRAGLVPADSLRRPGGEAPSPPRGRRIPEQISLLFFSGFFS